MLKMNLVQRNVVVTYKFKNVFLVLYMLIFRLGIDHYIVHVKHVANPNEALESNLPGPRKQLAGIGQAQRHAPEEVEAPMAAKGHFFLVGRRPP